MRVDVADDVADDEALVVTVVVSEDFVQALNSPVRLFSIISFMCPTAVAQCLSLNLTLLNWQTAVYVRPGNLVISLITEVNAAAMSSHLLVCSSVYLLFDPALQTMLGNE